MASVKRKQISSKVRTIVFKDKDHEITFGLLKGSQDLRVLEIRSEGINLIAEAVLSKEWVVENILPAVHFLNDDGVLAMKTPLGSYFGFTKDNLKSLSRFLNF